ncbi:MAG: di-heme oxidoredictase family protein [Candidatus Tectimicrobiota bacterium]
MKLLSAMLSRASWFLRLLCVMLLISGCDDSGSVVDTTRPAPNSGGTSTIDDRNLSAVAGPVDRSQLRPVERVPRARYGQVGQFPLQSGDLDTLVYPSANASQREAIMEGLLFFTFPHTEAEGAGHVANQRMCLGCHTNSFEAVTTNLDGTPNGIVGFSPTGGPRISQVSRAVRATPTNFDHTALVLDPADPHFGGGRAAGALNSEGILSADFVEGRFDAINDTGHTAAFTIFGNFSPAAGSFDSLDFFSGTVQHTRPSNPACLPDPILPVSADPNLRGGIDPATGLSPLGLRRAVGERAGPPYIGRGLMEAIFDNDLVAQGDEDDSNNNASSLDVATQFFDCRGDCISGRHNLNTSNQAFVGGDPVVRVGRFGLRAAGPTMLQFITGGAQGELGFTTILTPVEPNNSVNSGRQSCQDRIPDPELPLSALFSCRNLLRMTAPPEFGDTLRTLLESANPEATQPAGSHAAMVQRGARLFGVDLIAFANRMVPAKTQAGRTDGRDRHARASDRMLDCAGCHTPVHETGQSPSEVGAEHLSHVWAPIFSDLLLHQLPVINGERIASTPRIPLPINRMDVRNGGGVFRTFDLARNFADDALPNQGIANGTEFRTPPLMGMGVMGPPFFHDARVYLSRVTQNTTPAGTVTSNSTVTNAPLVVRTLDDAILATIELHDLPAPDNIPGSATFDATRPPTSTATGGGCPVPPGGRQGEIIYIEVPETTPANVICPPYVDRDAAGNLIARPGTTAATGTPSAGNLVTQRNRGEARKTMRRFRSLTPADQQALIEFLKQL